jgi:hypothetical protein
MATTETPGAAPKDEQSDAAAAAAAGGAPPPPPPEPEIKRGKARSVVEAMMPLVEAYAGRFATQIDVPDAESKTGLFTPREEAVLAAAGRKGFAEALEYTSRRYAVPGATPYEATWSNGEMKTPDALQLFSLFRAGSAFLGDGDDPATDTPGTPSTPEPQVELLAVKPGEYPYSNAPVTPAEARRAAYMQRIETPPPPAMLASQAGNGYAIVPAHTGNGSGGQAAMMYSYGSAQGTAVAHGAAWSHGGCQCSSCAGGATGFAFPPARYDEAGKCKSLFSISCETQWRLRECFKVALCDTLRCVSSEMCEDGQIKPNPDFKRCLEQFLCTIVACLPEAICPPEAPQAGCLPGGTTACGCNFAVGK